MFVEHAVRVDVDDVLAARAVQGLVEGLRLALGRAHPLHMDVGEALLAAGIHLKAVVRAAVVHQEDLDALVGIGALVDRRQARLERVRRVVDGDDQRNVGRVGQLDVGVPALEAPLYEHEHAGYRGDDLYDDGDDDPSRPKDEGVKQTLSCHHTGSLPPSSI